MNEKLDIIPIHVIADSANKAEMLNGLLRARGLAVKPLWGAELGEVPGSPPELVFYFADTESPGLAQAVEYAHGQSAPLIVVGRGEDPEAAAEALAAGAADWVRVEHDELLAAVARRERERRLTLQRLRQLERDNEHNRELLNRRFSGSRDAIVELNDGIIVAANAACADYLGFENAKALTGLPVMDLFAVASQSALKQAIKTALRKKSPQIIAACLRKADGGKREAKLEIAVIEHGDGERMQLRIPGDDSGDASSRRIEALEAENEALRTQTETERRFEPDSRLLKPGAFAPLAAQRLAHAQTGSTRALVAIRPANPEEAAKVFGPIGAAELAANLASAFSPALEPDDIATEVGGLTILALVGRPDQAAVENWIETTVATLGKLIFEGGGRSDRLDFAAGYAPVDRVRQLGALTRQALEAVGGAGTVSRSHSAATARPTDDVSWEARIREALEEHRYTVALRPIEDISTGERSWAALPRLLDRDGNGIGPESFQAPAEQLGLLPVLEHRLVGNALRALLHRRHKPPFMIVPLHVGTLGDRQFLEFLGKLIGRASKPPVPQSLVLEFDVAELAGQARDAERFAARACELDCAFGLRAYWPGGSARRLVESLPVASLRLSTDLVSRLGEDDALAAGLKDAVERFAGRGVRIIGTEVGDSATMAHLYNLGVGIVEGPMVGEPELFHPDE